MGMGRTSMKLGKLVSYGCGFMTFRFFSPFSQKKIGLPYKLMIFSRFPPQKIFPYHLYPNETWYTCSLLSSLYDVLILGPIFEKKIPSPSWSCNFFGDPQLATSMKLATVLSLWSMLCDIYAWVPIF